MKIKIKYLVPHSAEDAHPILLDCYSMKDAISVAGRGDPVYKLIKVGRVDMKGKYRPIKRRRK